MGIRQLASTPKMPIKENLIYVKLVGENIQPRKVRAKEIGRLLEDIESLIVEEAFSSGKFSKKDDVFISLYSFEKGSIGLSFLSPNQDLIVPPYLEAAKKISDNRFNELNSKSIESLRSLHGFSVKHSCNTELRIKNSKIPLAVLTPQMEIPEPAKIEGITEIVGRLLRVGGKKPRAQIEMSDGYILYSDVNRDVVKRLGHFLYSTVIFKGKAKWDMETLDLEEFTIDDFQEFKNRDPLETFERLSDLVGESFSEVHDVVEFVSNLRDGEF